MGNSIQNGLEDSTKERIAELVFIIACGTVLVGPLLLVAFIFPNWPGVAMSTLIFGLWLVGGFILFLIKKTYDKCRLNPKQQPPATA